MGLIRIILVLPMFLYFIASCSINSAADLLNSDKYKPFDIDMH